MRAEPMENNNPILNGILLSIAWFFAWIDLKALPIVLSSLASLCVIVNQAVTFLEKKNKRRGRR